MSRSSKKKIKNEISKIVISILLIIGIYIYSVYLEEPINNFLKSLENDSSLPVTSNRVVDGDLLVYFIDVGQADCILIENNDHYSLIDAGNNEDGRKLVTYFKSLGITKFDYVIGTHAHEDHIGGMDDIIKNFDISKFYMPDVITTTMTFEDVVVALEDKNLAFDTPKINSTFNMGDVEFKTLYVGSEGDDLNDTSIILKMTYGNNSFLFTGDAPSGVEKKILDKDIESDLLKVGHHGSQYSTSARFLEKVNPKYAIIQAGKGNSYGHPRSETLNRLKKQGIITYRTDNDGTIIASSDGATITFKTMETDTNG